MPPHNDEEHTDASNNSNSPNNSQNNSNTDTSNNDVNCIDISKNILPPIVNFTINEVINGLGYTVTNQHGTDISGVHMIKII